MPRTFALAGATGLVGRAALAEALADNDVARIIAYTRRPLPGEHPKLTTRLTEFSDRDGEPPEPCDAALCALGTTIRKAGSREAFRQVDFDHVLTFARRARRSGARTVVFVSSVGADPDSGNFYLRTKGEAEAAIRALGFDSTYFLRPGLLLGERDGDFRFGERLAAPLMRAAGPLLRGELSKYRAIPADAVGRAMVRCALAAEPGVHVLYNTELSPGRRIE